MDSLHSIGGWVRYETIRKLVSATSYCTRVRIFWKSSQVRASIATGQGKRIIFAIQNSYILIIARVSQRWIVNVHRIQSEYWVLCIALLTFFIDVISLIILIDTSFIFIIHLLIFSKIVHFSLLFVNRAVLLYLLTWFIPYQSSQNSQVLCSILCSIICKNNAWINQPENHEKGKRNCNLIFFSIYFAWCMQTKFDSNTLPYLVKLYW